jgi:NCS1 family nucleobase:cation symporter-1
MYTMKPTGRYWFRNGYNPNAVNAVAISGAISIASVLIPKILLDTGTTTVNATWIGNYSWFLGCALGYVIFWALEHHAPMIKVDLPGEAAGTGTLSDGRTVSATL